jgi:hypothetical protein
VVLCKDGKEQMEKELNLFIKKADLKGTSVVFRQGSRLMIGDLDKVSVSTARSVVVFSDTTMVPDQADAEILQVILNLNNMSLSGHVVAEVRDKDNEALIHLIGRGNVETVVSHDIIGRLMLMAVRQPGLAEVYGSILGFEGDEFYTEHWPQLVGTKWKDVQLMLPEAVPIGIRNSKNGEITLNPSHDHVMTERCELVVIAEDNDTYAPKQRHRCDPGVVPILENERTKRSTSCSRAGAATCAIFCCSWTRCAPRARRFTSWPAFPSPIATRCCPRAASRLILFATSRSSTTWVTPPCAVT